MTQEKSKLSKAIDDAIIHALIESDGLTLLSKHFIEHFKESGFTIVSTVPSDDKLRPVMDAISSEYCTSPKSGWLHIARAAIAAYVGAE